MVCAMKWRFHLIISAILNEITLAGEEQGVFKAFTRLQELLEQDELGIGTIGSQHPTPMCVHCHRTSRMKHGGELLQGALDIILSTVPFLFQP